MTTAVVTITCPRCGGRVDGITATSAEQTVACTYCRTELHVPRVGEVVREVVHERVIVQTELVVPSVRKRHTGLAAATAAVGLVFIGIFSLAAQTDADATIETFDRNRAAEQTCIAGCPADCAYDSALTVCKTTCELKCRGIDLHE